MMKRSKANGDEGGEASHTNDLGRSTVTEWMLCTLKEEGKVASLNVVHVPRSETMLKPRANEAIIFVAFFDMGLRLPSIEWVACVLRLYRVELAQLMPNSFVKLGGLRVDHEVCWDKRQGAPIRIPT